MSLCCYSGYLRLRKPEIMRQQDGRNVTLPQMSLDIRNIGIKPLINAV